MTELRDAVICHPLRTAVAGYGGQFRDVEVTTLAATVLRAVLDRSGLPAASTTRSRAG